MTTPSAPNSRNLAIIEEFRKNEGRVGGNFAGAPVLLFTVLGAKTGIRRTTPVMYLPDGDRFVIFASKGGSPENPAWYHNLRAHPEDVTVEVGTKIIPCTAEIVKGEERDRLYAKQSTRYPQFAQYEKRTTRKIPVIALEPRH